MNDVAGMVDVSVEECSKLIGQYEATDQGKVEGLMSIDGEQLDTCGTHRIQIILIIGALCSNKIILKKYTSNFYN